MSKNNKVETAKNSQTTDKNIQTENTTAKASKVPTGKVITIKESDARKKAREEQYKNFRVAALKRRCKRMKISDEDTKKYVEELIKQINAPNTYRILIFFNKEDINMVKEAIKNANLTTDVMSDSHIMMTGDQNTLGILRSIMPPKAKIHQYVIKKPSVLPEQKKEVIKKPSNNTAEAKANAKHAKRGHRMHGSKRWFHDLQKGRIKDSNGTAKKIRVHSSEFYLRNGKPLKRGKPTPRPNKGTNPTKVKIGKRAWKKANNVQAILTLSERVSKQKAITAQMKVKKPSEGSKTAKKAA
jgi:hypothetical protein